MIRNPLARACALGLALASGTAGAFAAELHVRPVLVDLPAPAAAATLTLNNRGKGLITAQVRVFRWTQKNGKDVLVPTRDVVASPPLMRMRPNRDHVIRIVRITKRPVKGEESYRLLVDQIPERKKKGVGVVFAVRYSIPVFYHEQGLSPARLSWQARRKGRTLILTARNTGQRHERLARLKLVTARGRTLTLSKGLAGYVLGGSTKVWKVKAPAGLSGTITIKGQGLNGPIKAKVRLR